jgi:hypothetical protein
MICPRSDIESLVGRDNPCRWIRRPHPIHGHSSQTTANCKRQAPPFKQVRRIATAPRKIRLRDLALSSNRKPARAEFSFPVEYNTNLSPQMNFFSVVAIFFSYNAIHQMDTICEAPDWRHHASTTRTPSGVNAHIASKFQQNYIYQ